MSEHESEQQHEHEHDEREQSDERDVVTRAERKVASMAPPRTLDDWQTLITMMSMTYGLDLVVELRRGVVEFLRPDESDRAAKHRREEAPAIE